MVKKTRTRREPSLPPDQEDVEARDEGNHCVWLGDEAGVSLWIEWVALR